jgi:hypothetical protein
MVKKGINRDLAFVVKKGLSYILQKQLSIAIHMPLLATLNNTDTNVVSTDKLEALEELCDELALQEYSHNQANAANQRNLIQVSEQNSDTGFLKVVTVICPIIYKVDSATDSDSKEYQNPYRDFGKQLVSTGGFLEGAENTFQGISKLAKFISAAEKQYRENLVIKPVNTIQYTDSEDANNETIVISFARTFARPDPDGKLVKELFNHMQFLDVVLGNVA